MTQDKARSAAVARSVRAASIGALVAAMLSGWASPALAEPVSTPSPTSTADPKDGQKASGDSADAPDAQAWSQAVTRAFYQMSVEADKPGDECLAAALPVTALSPAAAQVFTTTLRSRSSADLGRAVAAVRDTSAEGAAAMVSAMAQVFATTVRFPSSADLGRAVAAVRDTSTEGAAVLVSADTRQKVDACIDARFPAAEPQILVLAEEHVTEEGEVIPAQTEVIEASYTRPAGPRPRPEREASGDPQLEVRENATISAESDLAPGLGLVFASYAHTDAQRVAYAKASECFAQTALKAKLSPETLRFLASGPAISSASLADALPNEVDRATWASPSFTGALMGCL